MTRAHERFVGARLLVTFTFAVLTQCLAVLVIIRLGLWGFFITPLLFLAYIAFFGRAYLLSLRRLHILPSTALRFISPIIAAIVLLFCSFTAGGYIGARLNSIVFHMPSWMDEPMPARFSSDHSLMTTFNAHKKAFERIAQLAVEDATIASSATNPTLSSEHRAEYARLLDELKADVKVGFDPSRITFWFAFSGILTIGPESAKGIAFLPHGPTRVGKLVDSLDVDPGHDDVYLRTIDDGWYIIFQRSDYDRP